MKRTLSLFMIIALLLSNIASVGVYAQTNVDKQMEEAILKVKDILSISDEYDRFDSRINASDEMITFYLNWNDIREKLPSIRVAVDSKGNIKSYNKRYSHYIEPDTKLPRISMEEGEKIAREFIGKLDKDVENNIVLNDKQSPFDYQSQEYNFNFTRVVGKIPYYDNGIYMNVNKYTGEVMYYRIDWDRDVVFPDANKAISMEEGKKLFKDNIGLELIYRRFHNLKFDIPNSNEKTNYFLVYSTMNDRMAIDALTGKLISLRHHFDMANEAAAAGAGDSGVEERAITPQERTEIDKVSGIKDISEIENIARETLDIDNSYKLKSKNLYSYWQDSSELQWSLYFAKDIDKEDMITANIDLDAKTGDVISFYHRLDLEKGKASIDKDQALDLAKDYLLKLNPDKKDSVEYRSIDDMEKDSKIYNFRFNRKDEDIYIDGDGISIGVDAVNRRIYSYSKDWYNGELPPKGEIISIDKAYDILFQQIGYELKYISMYDRDGEKKEIKLVYSQKPGKPLNISATNGEILDFRGKPFRESGVISYKDIDNSYAKDKIKGLAEYGIAFGSEEFRPNDKILQKDFMYLLWKSIYPYGAQDEEDIDRIYKELRSQNIIIEGEKAPDRYVTKEEAVKYIIRAMKYEKIAEIDDIYRKIFADESHISKGLRGYISLAYGLDIIQGDGKPTPNINPKYELKREDAANIIYNYVFN